jgi:RNA polymerase sigma-70 factor (ECF subfamily)
MREYSSYTDEQLLHFTSESDSHAYTEIYYRYSKDIYLVAWNGTRDRDKAEDIVQEVFVSLWQRRKEVEITILKGWLLGATRFQVLKAFRQQKADTNFLARLANASQVIFENDPAAFKELQERIPAVMGSLPEDQQEIFRLHREEQLTYREIADKLGISIKTVEKKMSLTLRHLRLGLDETITVLAVVYLCI